MSQSKKYNFLFGLSGSIAAYKACELISTLVKEGHRVQVVTSKSALEFVGKATLEGLSGRPIYANIFEPGQAMQHIDLARWCDAFIVYPASANTLNRLSAGLSDDAIGSLFLALESKIPKFIAPAMNPQMMAHPSVQNSVETLKKWGCDILPAQPGLLACGETGVGRLIEPQEAFQRIFAKLQPKKNVQPAKSLPIERQMLLDEPGENKGKVIITSGGTREPIDGVRFLTNMSTGRTAAQITDELIEKGYQVIYLHSQDAIQPELAPYKKVPFTSFNVLNQTLRSILNIEEVDLIIHAAAVSDYSVETIEYKDKSGSLASTDPSVDVKIKTAENMNLKLKPNFKIVDRIKSYSRNKDIRVVAFKLTHTDEKQSQIDQVRELFDHSQADAVVHNDFSQLKSTKRFHFFTKTSELKFEENPIDLKTLGREISDFGNPSQEAPL